VRELVYRPLALEDLREIYRRRAEAVDADSAAVLVAALQER
jgi:hypothetical protein